MESNLAKGRYEYIDSSDHQVKPLYSCISSIMNLTGDIYFGFDEVVAIFATEDTIEYIWKMRDKNDFEYIARTVDNEEIANAIAEYPQYIKDGGCIDVSEWLSEKYGDSILSVDYSVDYEVMTTIGRIW